MNSQFFANLYFDTFIDNEKLSYSLWTNIIFSSVNEAGLSFPLNSKSTDIMSTLVQQFDINNSKTLFYSLNLYDNCFGNRWKFISFFADGDVLFLIFLLLFLLYIPYYGSLDNKGLSKTAANEKLKLLLCYGSYLLFFILIIYYSFTLGIFYVGHYTEFFHEIFNGYLYCTTFTVVVKIFLLLVTSAVLNISTKYIVMNKNDIVEYSFFIFSGTYFLTTIISANNLISLLAALTGFSIVSYILLISDFGRLSNIESTVKYYILSLVSTGFFAFGILLTFFFCQTTQYVMLQTIIENYAFSNLIDSNVFGFFLMLSFLVLGLLFKLAAFPAHLWAPEVYHGAPTAVLVYLILPAKFAIFLAVSRFLLVPFYSFYFIWSFWIWIAAIGSMLWGAFGALTELKIKKFIAYSSINQMGFILIGLASGTFNGICASLIYFIVYIAMNLILFIILMNTYKFKCYAPSNLSGKNDIVIHSEEIDGLRYFSELKDFAKTNIIFSIGIILVFFSMAGIPPLAGFFSKYFLFVEAFAAEQYFLIIVALFTSVISTYYYLRIIKNCWFDDKSYYFDNLLLFTKQVPEKHIANKCLDNTKFFIYTKPIYITYLLNWQMLAVYTFSTIFILFFIFLQNYLINALRMLMYANFDTSLALELFLIQT